MQAPLVAIEGPPGVGKTVLVHRLAQELGVPECTEPVHTNPYLTRFYKDMRRWSFPMQVQCLQDGARVHRWAQSSPSGAILDRSIWGHALFAYNLRQRGVMGDKEYQTYIGMFHGYTRELRRPDMMFFLNAEPATCLARIRTRSRRAEVPITEDYLESLCDAHRHLFEEMEVWLQPRGLSCHYLNWQDPDAHVGGIIEDIHRWPREVARQFPTFT